jgi:glycosyltransferase involved in cell wall biosynthesis
MIEDPYLEVIMIPCFIDREGRRSVDPLWHKDLVQHLACIRNMMLAAPARHEAPTFGVVPIDHSTVEGNLSYVDLPPCISRIGAILSIPAAAMKLWRAVGEADIVHINVGGWPFSFGWIAAPMAKLRGKFVLTQIEGATWRGDWQKPWELNRVIRGLIFEGMARFCVNLSDLALFTHTGYRDSMLMKRRRSRGHVICASWIDREVVLSQSQAEECWRIKLEDRSRPLRVVFAAGLKPSKGVMVLLHALKMLDRRGIPVEVRVYGAGVLRDACAQAARQLNRSVALDLCDELAYGAELFAMLRGHDILVAPNLSDEQPRIIYDSFSQALPILGSDTSGLKQCVSHEENGLIVPAGDAAALADAIEWASEHRERLRDFGIAGLDVARGLTHDQMHQRRAELILEAKQRGRSRCAGSHRF